MANLQQTIQQLMKQGNTYGQQQQQQQQGKNDWQKKLALMAFANRANPRAMAGFALGDILSQLAGKWRNDYDRRGQINRGLVAASPEERAKMLSDLQQTDQPQYERSLKNLAKHGIDAGVGGETPQAGGGEINSDTTSRLAQQALGTGLPTEGSNLIQQALTQGAANFDFNNLPEVPQPFLADGGDSPFAKAVKEAAQREALVDKDIWSQLAGLFGR